MNARTTSPTRRLAAIIAALLLTTITLGTALRSASAATGGGEVVSWGWNTAAYGGTTVPDEAKSGVTAVAAGGGHSLALKDGRVIAWGNNQYGETTVPDEAKSGVTAVAAGNSHSLALKNGRVIAWGNNQFGETTVPDEAKSGVTAVAAGLQFSLALKDGRVIGWGHGIGAAQPPAEARSGVTAIAAIDEHSLALKDGKVIAWGWNGNGESTVPLAARSGVTAIAAGGDHSLALKDGKVIAWGWNGYGQTDVPIAAQSGVTAIASGGGHNLALKDGKVIAWGNNVHGQTTVPPEATSGVTAIAAGGSHSLALVGRPTPTPGPSTKNDPRNVPPGEAADSNWWDWPDTDGDGIPDYWETNGVWVDGKFADLHRMGLDPKHKDLILTLDYEEGQKPSPLTEQTLIDQFKNAPLDNPDGTSGVALHIRSGNPVPTSTIGNFHLPGPDVLRVATASGFANDPLSGGRDGVPQLSQWLVNIKYGVPGRDYQCGGKPSSGCAFFKFGWITIGVSGFTAALQMNDLLPWSESGRDYATGFVTAVVAGHELGHELGLQHHGATPKPEYDPHYKSIMSYSYSHFGLPTWDSGLISLPKSDYSREQTVNYDWEMASPDGRLGKLTFIYGQYGEFGNFYNSNYFSQVAANSLWVDDTGTAPPTEQDLAEAIRDADPTVMAQFIKAAEIPIDYQPPTLPDATATAVSGRATDLTLQGHDPMGPVTYQVTEQSPLGTAVETPTGVRFTANPGTVGVTTLSVRAIGPVFGSSPATIHLEVTPEVTPSPSPTPSATPSATPTPTATPSSTPSATPSPSGTPSPTATPTDTPTVNPTPSPAPSVTPSRTPGYATPTTNVTPAPTTPDEPGILGRTGGPALVALVAGLVAVSIGIVLIRRHRRLG